MRISKKFVSILLVILTITWAANIVYYKRNILKQPVFLKHYYDLEKTRNAFDLHYINNIDSEVDVAYVNFPEIDNSYINSSSNRISDDGRHYMIGSVRVEIGKRTDKGIVMDQEIEKKVITKINIFLTNGKMITQDIGKIYLGGEEDYSKYIQVGTSYTGENLGITNYYPHKDIKLLGVKSKFPELLNENLKVKINGKPLREISFPIEISEKEGLEVTHDMRNIIENSNPCSFTFVVLTEDNQGTKGEVPIIINCNSQFPQRNMIKNMLKEGGNN